MKPINSRIVLKPVSETLSVWVDETDSDTRTSAQLKLIMQGQTDEGVMELAAAHDLIRRKKVTRQSRR